MRISEVNITPIKPQNGLVAFASVVLDDCLYLSSIGVYARLDGTGYRLTYPTKKVAEKSLNIYHPISKNLAKEIENSVLAKAKTVFNAHFPI